MTDPLVQQTINLHSVTQKLSVSPKQLANILGVDSALLSQNNWPESSTLAKRLQDMLAILDQLEKWTNSTEQALASYRDNPIPSLGNRTAEDLVQADRGSSMRAYLARIDEGGYA